MTLTPQVPITARLVGGSAFSITLRMPSMVDLLVTGNPAQRRTMAVASRFRAASIRGMVSILRPRVSISPRSQLPSMELKLLKTWRLGRIPLAWLWVLKTVNLTSPVSLGIFNSTIMDTMSLKLATNMI